MHSLASHCQTPWTVCLLETYLASTLMSSGEAKQALALLNCTSECALMPSSLHVVSAWRSTGCSSSRLNNAVAPHAHVRGTCVSVVACHRAQPNEASYGPAFTTCHAESPTCVTGCRLADGKLYVAHPVMFRPFVERHLGKRFDDGPTLSHDVLVAAEQLTADEFDAAGTQTPADTVQPAPLQLMLSRCVQLRCASSA